MSVENKEFSATSALSADKQKWVEALAAVVSQFLVHDLNIFDFVQTSEKFEMAINAIPNLISIIPDQAQETERVQILLEGIQALALPVTFKSYLIRQLGILVKQDNVYIKPKSLSDFLDSPKFKLELALYNIIYNFYEENKDKLGENHVLLLAAWQMLPLDQTLMLAFFSGDVLLVREKGDLALWVNKLFAEEAYWNLEVVAPLKKLMTHIANSAALVAEKPVKKISKRGSSTVFFTTSMQSKIETSQSPIPPSPVVAMSSIKTAQEIDQHNQKLIELTETITLTGVDEMQIDELINILKKFREEHDYINASTVSFLLESLLVLTHPKYREQPQISTENKRITSLEGIEVEVEAESNEIILYKPQVQQKFNKKCGIKFNGTVFMERTTSEYNRMLLAATASKAYIEALNSIGKTLSLQMQKATKVPVDKNALLVLQKTLDLLETVESHRFILYIKFVDQVHQTSSYKLRDAKNEFMGCLSVLENNIFNNSKYSVKILQTDLQKIICQTTPTHSAIQPFLINLQKFNAELKPINEILEHHSLFSESDSWKLTSRIVDKIKIKNNFHAYYLLFLNNLLSVVLDDLLANLQLQSSSTSIAAASSAENLPTAESVTAAIEKLQSSLKDLADKDNFLPQHDFFNQFESFTKMVMVIHTNLPSPQSSPQTSAQLDTAPVVLNQTTLLSFY